MPQSFMYKRINIFLLVLMCLIVVGLAGSAIYFQESFKSLSSNYESVMSNYSTCQDVLADKESRLQGCVDDLNSTAQDIGKYDTLYEEKVGELEQTEQELQTTTEELRESLNTNRQLETEIEQQRQETQNLRQQIQTLNQRIQNLEDQVDSCQDALDACEDAS